MFFFFQAEDGIRDKLVTGVQTCALPICNPVRILLVDDQVVFRVAVRALLERHRDLVVVGEAGRGEEAVASAKATRPDVVLMDLAMPGKGGIEATRRITRLGIGARVLVLTALPQERELLDALDAGATGFVEKMEAARSEEHTSELQSLAYLVCRLLLEKKKIKDDSSQVV